MEYTKILAKGIFMAALAFGFVFAACDTGNGNKPKTYTVTWKNYDNRVLETDTNVTEGTIPSYDGETPERDEDTGNTYTFSGWNPVPAPVTADEVYTAQFTATAICTCPEKAHLGIGETCNCGGENCTCGLKVYGTLSNGIKIYREGAIDDMTMEDRVQRVIGGLNTLPDTTIYTAGDVANKIDEIRIVDNSGQFYYKNIGGKFVLGVDIARTQNQIRTKLGNICAGEIPEVALMQSNNAIRMARVMTFDALLEKIMEYAPHFT